MSPDLAVVDGETFRITQEAWRAFAAFERRENERSKSPAAARPGFRPTEQAERATAHLTRSFVRKGDRQNARRARFHS